ncbi:DUF805 domain-containing protein [Alcanivorax jadensis]|uniref:DUF805 domain-containing protein n=1 Tax=Alcanivorax jadensis TaxID=64988 RepID=UPI00240A1858|nr:DUF805 domain-containing protein [Alcanivorax jadensis]MDF1637873.1 DUF805 domain-containing protein [Alcanivorax jadensis]
MTNDHEQLFKPGFNGRGNLVYEPLSVLSLSQRLGRLRYACYQFSAWIITFLLIALAMLFSAEMVPEIVGIGFSLVFGLFLLIYTVGLMVRRLHDMDLSGWWSLLSLVPILNLPFHLYLYLGDGSSSMNRYGTPNPLPSGIVTLAGGLFWVINVLFITATIAFMVIAWLAPEWLLPYVTQLPDGWLGVGRGWIGSF